MASEECASSDKVVPADSPLPNRNQPRILIVDDTRENIQILVEALSGEYKISVATNGEDALRIAASQIPEADDVERKTF